MRSLSYVVRDGKRLRQGVTTGTCAAAAAKAAAICLLSGDKPQAVALVLPGGREVSLDVCDYGDESGAIRCAVQKDSGDDPDVTHGVFVHATVQKAQQGIDIDGGVGVGRVTKPGLDQPVGAAAINSVPRSMIRDALSEVAAAYGYAGGFSVIISIPAGEALAERTFNPRLGILGGLSVIGTTGIVDPMSDVAIVETVRTELNMRRAAGKAYALLTPGNYGEAFIRSHFQLAESAAVQCSNFIGDALRISQDMGFDGVLLVGHLGKLVKLAGGMMNTHSRYGDCRMELLAAHAAQYGLGSMDAKALFNAATVEEGLRILHDAGTMQETLQSILRAIQEHMKRCAPKLQQAVVIFTKAHGLLAQSEGAQTMLWRLCKEEEA